MIYTDNKGEQFIKIQDVQNGTLVLLRGMDGREFIDAPIGYSTGVDANCKVRGKAVFITN